MNAIRASLPCGAMTQNVPAAPVPADPILALDQWHQHQTGPEPGIDYATALERFQSVCQQIQAVDQGCEDRDSRPGNVQVKNSNFRARLEKDGPVFIVQFAEYPNEEPAACGDILNLKPGRFEDHDRIGQYVAITMVGSSQISVHDTTVSQTGQELHQEYFLRTDKGTIEDYKLVK